MSEYDEMIEHLEHWGINQPAAADAIRALLRERDEAQSQIDALQARVHLCAGYEQALALLREALPFVEMELRWSKAHEHLNEANDCAKLVDSINAALAGGEK